MNQEQYIKGSVDTAINHQQDLSMYLALEYTVTQTSRIHYKIDFEWREAYDNHKQEYVIGEGFVMWTQGQEVQSMDHVDKFLEELSKVEFDDDYNSRTEKLENQGQSQLDSLRNK